jgi:hypothetical protein
MHHHAYRTPAVLALVGATALSLTACGGSGGEPSGKSDRIAGADAGKPEASPRAGAGADPVKGRPEIVLPKDVKMTFEGASTGDTVKDTVLADNAGWQNAVAQAVTTIGTKTKADTLTFYSTGDALMNDATYIKSYYDRNKAWVGETRIYDREATVGKDGTATVSYCSDATKTYPKDRKTGKVTRLPGSDADYVFYRTSLKKNAKGVWQTVNVTSTGEAKQCM